MHQAPLSADHMLDITREVCPMTFVRTRLKVEAMAPGELLEIRLAGEEPGRNVPESLTELGHEILILTPLDERTETGLPIYRLVVRKS